MTSSMSHFTRPRMKPRKPYRTLQGYSLRIRQPSFGWVFSRVWISSGVVLSVDTLSMLVTEWVVKKTIRKTEFLKGEGIGGSVFPIPFSPLLYWFYKYLCGWKCYLSVGFFVFLWRGCREAAVCLGQMREGERRAAGPKLLLRKTKNKQKSASPKRGTWMSRATTSGTVHTFLQCNVITNPFRERIGNKVT